jgi:hypothetical protein
MSHLRLRCEFDDGHTVEVTPTFFEPPSAAQLEEILADPARPTELAFHGVDAVIDDEPMEGTPRLTTRINFAHSPAPYALVACGWLPMPFATPQYFLVDRNVLATLRAIRNRGPRPGDTNFCWWTQLFDGATTLFNPLLYAYEGQHRRTPTMAEFVAAYNEGLAELETAFPRAALVQYEQVHFEAAYGQLRSLGERAGRDFQFLLKTIPLVANRVPRSREKLVQAQVLQQARDLGVIRDAPVVLAVLSVLYEDTHGKRPAYGRRLLKPKINYSTEDAYNAISDLRHIELAALSQAVLSDRAFALCTNDRGVALFWSALEFRGTATPGAALNLGIH